MAWTVTDYQRLFLAISIKKAKRKLSKIDLKTLVHLEKIGELYKNFSKLCRLHEKVYPGQIHLLFVKLMR